MWPTGQITQVVSGPFINERLQADSLLFLKKEAMWIPPVFGK